MAFSILRFDMRSPGYTPEQRRDLYAAALEMGAWGEANGFDQITLSEHHATADGYLPAPLALGGVFVGRTQKIRIAIVALLLPLYDPIKLAEELAVLDYASGGRFGATLGMGYRPEEYAMFGKSWEGRGALMDECLDALLRAWSGEPFEWQGRRVHLTPKPLTQPKPPVMVGGLGRNGARRAARFGLPYQPGVGTPEVLQLYREECEKRGVTPLAIPPGSAQMIWVAEDPDRLWSQIGPYLLHDAMTYRSWQLEGQHSAVTSSATTVEALRAEGKYRILTPDECAQRTLALGPFADVVHFPLCGGIPPQLAWPSLELYASQVLPRLRAPAAKS